MAALIIDVRAGTAANGELLRTSSQRIDSAATEGVANVEKAVVASEARLVELQAASTATIDETAAKLVDLERRLEEVKSSLDTELDRRIKSLEAAGAAQEAKLRQQASSADLQKLSTDLKNMEKALWGIFGRPPLESDVLGGLEEEIERVDRCLQTIRRNWNSQSAPSCS